jgi:hypothetical protein
MRFKKANVKDVLFKFQGVALTSSYNSLILNIYQSTTLLQVLVICMDGALNSMING